MEIDTNSPQFIRDSRRAFGLPDEAEPKAKLDPDAIAAILARHQEQSKLRISDQGRTGRRYPLYPGELSEHELLRLSDEQDVRALATRHFLPLSLDAGGKQQRDAILGAYRANRRAATEAAVAERQARDDELYAGTGVQTGRLSPAFLDLGD